MAPVGSRLRAIGASTVLLGVVLPTVAPFQVRGADDSISLPDATTAAVRLDMDGDGALDLARLVEAPGGAPAVEVWAEDADAGWDRIASVPVPWPTNGDVDASNAAMGTALLVARIGGIPSLMVVATLVDPGAATAVTCCLTIHVAGLDGDRLQLDTHPIAGASAHEVLVLDFDGDGTDELVAISTQDPFDPAEPPTSTLTVFGWRDRGLELLAERERAGFPMGSVVGDVDGQPGVELITALEQEPRLERLAWDGKELVFTVAGAPSGPQGPGWPAGVLDGHLVYVDEAGVSILSWPGGGEISRVDRISAPSFPGAVVVGSGDASLLIIEGGENPFEPRSETAIYDESLDRLGSFTVPPAAAEARSLLADMGSSGQGMAFQPRWAFSGAFPSSGREAAGWIGAAGMVRPDGDDGWRLEPMAPMLGAPIGLLGHGDAWLAICEACWNTDTQAFISPGLPSDRPNLILARREARSPDDDAPMDARYEGAVVQRVEGNVTTLMARSSGAVIELPVPPGSEVVSSADGPSTQRDGGESSFRLEVPGVGGSGSRDSWGATVLVIGADTRFRIHRWEATYAPAGGPAVSAVTESSPFQLSATITGTADTHAAIFVDGEPVAVDHGRFTHWVSATPWPRTVAVRAVDPFGTERTVGIEVVGFVDARGLPLVPIVGTTTLLFGAILFLRVPRREPHRSEPDGEGSLEELDGDLV